MTYRTLQRFESTTYPSSVAGGVRLVLDDAIPCPTRADAETRVLRWAAMGEVARIERNKAGQWFAVRYCIQERIT